jgi:nuclear GTP-binding protein
MPTQIQGSSDKVNGRTLKKGDTFMRSAATIRRLQMYRGGKPDRTRDGKITGGELMGRDKAGGEDITSATGRIAPDRRWFGNTRVIGATQLDTFRAAMAERSRDPYTVVLHSKTLPVGLLSDTKTVNARADLLGAESFGSVFGPKAQRKRVRLTGASASGDINDYVAAASAASNKYGSGETDGAKLPSVLGDLDIEARDARREPLFDKGTSKRIWGELYKVLDCSDIVIQVLDARDPAGTRCNHVEKYLREHARHKHLIFVLNKVDLVPTWVTRRWVASLSAEYPTLAFHASLTHPFGKGALIALLRQLARLHADKKSVSVGFIGYPNVGKSSVINALRAKKVCKVAPIPGETKVWQYVTLMKRVSLIVC